MIVVRTPSPLPNLSRVKAPCPLLSDPSIEFGLKSLFVSLARTLSRFPHPHGLKAFFQHLPDPSLILGLNSLVVSLARTPSQFPKPQGLKEYCPLLPDRSLILGLNSLLLSLARTPYLLSVLTCLLNALKQFGTDPLLPRTLLSYFWFIGQGVLWLTTKGRNLVRGLN